MNNGLDAVRGRYERAQAKPKREPSPALLKELGLSERESDVLFWMSQGKSNPEICTLLDLRLTTVKKHVERILQKLGVENRTSAAAAAIEKLNEG